MRLDSARSLPPTRLPVQVDPIAVEGLLREAARRFILPRFQALEPHEVQSKSSRPHDVVTVADLEAEAFLSPALQELLPDSLVVGEEAVSRDCDRLKALEEDEPVWVIDPVDGTWNFSRGRPTFCVIVALVHRTETIGAWILAPVEGACAIAAPGEGAWLHQADGSRTRLRVDQGTSPKDWRVVIRGMAGGPLARMRASTTYREVVDEHCAGMEHLRLASGSLHIGLYSRIKPWDHAAGCLLHTEAGGHVARLDGEPYRPRGVVKGLLAAPNVAAWRFARSGLLGR